MCSRLHVPKRGQAQFQRGSRFSWRLKCKRTEVAFRKCQFAQIDRIVRRDRDEPVCKLSVRLEGPLRRRELIPLKRIVADPVFALRTIENPVRIVWRCGGRLRCRSCRA